MRDYIDGRLWAEHGHLFAEQIERLLKDLMSGFKRLVAIEFAAPWRRTPSTSC